MNNTTVTIKYADGSIRQFMASDELEKLITTGEMFSVTTIHPDQSADEICKMYAGNPMAALGNMVIMRRNAENLTDDDASRDVKSTMIEIITVCIKLLSDEITSHDSGLMPVRLVEATGSPEPFKAGTGERRYYHYQDETVEGEFAEGRRDCPAVNAPCSHFAYQYDSNGELTITRCLHPANPKYRDGNCTSLLCPLCTEGGG